MAYPFAAAEVLTAVDLNAMIGAPTQNAQTGTTYTAVLLDAGKTVTLSNASAVTLTIPAQASVSWADNTQLNFLNLGAGTVTITSAVDVTINGTPLTLETSKGGSLVRTDSNVWTFTPTGGGDSPGLNPIAPTSIANTGGSASTTLNTTTFTGVTSVSLNGVFTATYDNYLILVKFSSSTISGLELRLRVAGSDNTTSNYVRQRQLTYSTAMSGERTTDTRARILNTGTEINALRMEVMSPMLAEMTNFLSTGKSSESLASMFNAAACHNVSSAFDGITFLASSGNITGTITVYGYSK